MKFGNTRGKEMIKVSPRAGQVRCHTKDQKGRSLNGNTGSEKKIEALSTE